ncbi:DUF1003 domain-containing protein [Frigidibacter sp. MR17.24]|uniref:DUF1003 domain-containing protein n=1 Tax=Frigidibacter sp. MR17.24 TaxID=3127345 RepID=UPI003012CB52
MSHDPQTPADPVPGAVPTPRLSPVLQAVLGRIARHGHVARDTNARFDAEATLGQRVADRVAAFGGSWTFILLFLGLLAGWTAGNWLLGRAAPDPYPFIFLNLLLSMLAALQAPVIMMSQNRQAAKDRLDAAHDYEVNLKAEIEIMALHEKLDRLREQDLKAMLTRQQEQIDLLTRLMAERRP